MPELSRFYGIVVQMYYGDHAPPHFHALYAGQMAIVDIETLAFIDGQLPARARGMVVEWATLHQEELREAFRRAELMETPSKIAPSPESKQAQQLAAGRRGWSHCERAYAASSS